MKNHGRAVLAFNYRRQFSKGIFPTMFRFEFAVQRYPGGPLTLRVAVGRWLLTIHPVTE